MARGSNHRALVLGSMALLGCGREAMPDPQRAALKYAEALEQRDEDVLYELLTVRGRENLSKEGVSRLLREHGDELALRARGFRTAEESRSEAILPFPTGASVALIVEQGEFRIHGAGISPPSPPSPRAALAELRSALERRSLPALLGVLEERKKREWEDALTTLSRALLDLDAAVVEVRGDRAQVDLPDGVRLQLRRVQGAWFIEEIE